ncbi:MAG TPA: glycoside hydrolase family 2 TIM barrel-domain containing protein, partial [Flavisolibacter sp.]|nr:glycoside hydrolase family 2 TIM barrel-domain containing protein [Flavisolibacter sp.]
MRKIVLWSVLFVCVVIGKTNAQGRQVIPFNEGWQFKKAAYEQEVALINSTWQTVTLPHTWNNVDMQTTKNFYQGDAFYKKSFTPDNGWKDKQLYIRFEGVGAVADVYVNNQFIGEHRGGYSAFVFDISYAIKWGEENTIMVKVNNASRPDVIPINHSLFGVYGGIYRPVSLIVTPKLHIATTDYASPGIYIQQKNVSGQNADIIISAKLNNKTLQQQSCVLESDVYDNNGKLVKTTTSTITVLPQGIQKFMQQFSLKKPHLWNGLDDPYLYKVVTRIRQNGAVIDEVTQPLGIRHFEAVGGKGFFLNGKLYPLHGVPRHQDWWGYGSALSNEQHARDLDMIKEMGATSIRLAHYQQAEYMY